MEPLKKGGEYGNMEPNGWFGSRFGKPGRNEPWRVAWHEGTRLPNEPPYHVHSNRPEEADE